MSRHAPRRMSLLVPLVLVTLTACQDSVAPRPAFQAKARFAQGDNNVWTVTTLADPGDGVCDDAECTLREAIAAATSGGTILFASGLAGSINIDAGSGGFAIDSKDLTIDGGDLITLDAKGGPRVLELDGPLSGPAPKVKLAGIKITGGNYQFGGSGINAVRVSLTLDHVAVSGNTATNAFAAGIDLFDSEATITASTIANNVATAGDNLGSGRGGGVFVNGGSKLTLINTTVDGNGASTGAGIYNEGTLTVITSTFSNNQVAVGDGGALFVASGTVDIRGSTFSGNRATRGGAIANGNGAGTPSPEGGALTIRSSTITANVAFSIGGGIVHGGNGGGRTALANSILAGNQPSDCSTPSGGMSSLGRNLGSCVVFGSGDVTVQPAQVYTEVLEQELKDNGGPTKTHALIARGRAVDAGYCPGETKDQRGFIRPVDDATLPNAVDGCDIGAYELQGPVAAVADLMVSQSVDKPSAKQGDQVTYTIRVQNLGPQTAPSVVVSDILSSGSTFVEARSNRGSFTAPPNGETGTVTWSLGNMVNGANEVATISVTVIIKGKTTITNTASVTGAVADPNPANNSAAISVSVAAGGTVKKGK